MSDDVQILGKGSANITLRPNWMAKAYDAEKKILEYLHDYYNDDGSEKPADLDDWSEELADAERDMVRSREEFLRRKNELKSKKARGEYEKNKSKIWDSYLFESSDIRPLADQKADHLFQQFLRESNLPPSKFCFTSFQRYIRHLNPYAQVPICVLNADTIYTGKDGKSAGKQPCMLCGKYMSREDCYILDQSEAASLGSKFIYHGQIELREYGIRMRRKDKWLCKTHKKTYDAFQEAFKADSEGFNETLGAIMKRQREKLEQPQNDAQNNSVVAGPPPMQAGSSPPLQNASSSLASQTSVPQTSSTLSSQTEGPPNPRQVVKPKRQRKNVKKPSEVVQQAPIQMENSTPSPEAGSPTTQVSNATSLQTSDSSPPQKDNLPNSSLTGQTVPVVKKSRARKRQNVNANVIDSTISPGLPIGSQLPVLTTGQLAVLTSQNNQLIQNSITNVISNPSNPMMAPSQDSISTIQYNFNFPPPPSELVIQKQGESTTNALDKNLMALVQNEVYSTAEPVFKKPRLPPKQRAPPRSRTTNSNSSANSRRRGGNARAPQTSSDATISSTPLPEESPVTNGISPRTSENGQFNANRMPVENGQFNANKMPVENDQFHASPTVLSPGTAPKNLDHPVQSSPEANTQSIASPAFSPKSTNQELSDANDLYTLVGSMSVYPEGMEPILPTNHPPQITNVAEATETMKQAEEFEDIYKKIFSGESARSSSSPPDQRPPVVFNNPEVVENRDQDPDISVLFNPRGLPDESLIMDIDQDALESLMHL